MSAASGAAAPGFWDVARRPRWIAALLLVLAIASAFAALGRWQLAQSIAAGTVNAIDTETPVPLDSVAEPGERVTAEAYARIVTVDEGEFAADSFVVLHGRLQHGEPGYWLVGLLATDLDPVTFLTVALGWAPTEEEAWAAIPPPPAYSDPANHPVLLSADYRGRYLPSEDPHFEDALTGERSALSVAEIINLWPDFSGEVYAGYLILDEAPVGLQAIDAPPPLPEQQVNLLNLFYAGEWIIFAGFSIYLWWRLVKDEVEKEAELAESAAAGESDPVPAVD